MPQRNFILATAGHVDHGKSALVKALTGIDPDRLPEEKARGITIDLGFAHLAIPGEIDGEPGMFRLGMVDVPGHEDFVKNMVAGVGSIDLALLIVAADDGWMPQTEEHLQILSYLGVSRAVVALTKIDLAPDEAVIRAELRAKLAGSPFAEAPIVATSVVSGRGLDELKGALAEVLKGAPAPRNLGKPRLPVDRVFMLRGIGTVVTGTLTGGEFQRGQAVVAQPRGLTARIRSVQSHNQEVEASGPGTRTALNLPDAKGPAGEKGIQRGEVITLPEMGEPGKAADVALEKSARLLGLKVLAARPLKDGARVRIHLGSGDVAARVLLTDRRSLEAGERGLAQLRFEEPIFAFAGDRFIVRDWAEQATLAGGVVLDPDPPAEKSGQRAEQLAARAGAPGDAAVFALTELQRFRAVRGPRLLVKSRFGAEDIAGALKKLLAEKKARLESGWAIDAGWWGRLLESAAKIIDAEHAAHPDRAGLAAAEFKAGIVKEFPGDLPAAEFFELLIRDLSRGGFTHAGTVIKRKSHQLRLPPQLQAAGAKVREALAAKLFDPPSRKEVAPDAASQQALRYLVEIGEAIDLSAEVVLLAEAFQRAAERVRSFLQARGAGTASEIRQDLETSRRVLIPLLERLDREGITRREGDRRVLRKS